MRLVAIAALLLAFFLPADGSQQKHPTDSKQAAAEQTQTQSSVTILDNHCASDEKKSSASEQPQHWPPSWYSPFWPNWAFVFVGLGAATAAVWTLFAIKDQASHMSSQVDLMKKQIAVQEAAFSQWVVLDNWDAKTQKTIPSMLHVTFDIINESNYPITLEGVAIKTAAGSQDYGSSRKLITPKHPYKAAAAFNLHSAHLDLFKAGNLGMGIQCRVSYETVLKKHKTQEFVGILQCGEGVETGFTDWLNQQFETAPETPEHP